MMSGDAVGWESAAQTVQFLRSGGRMVGGQTLSANALLEGIRIFADIVRHAEDICQVRCSKWLGKCGSTFRRPAQMIEKRLFAAAFGAVGNI